MIIIKTQTEIDKMRRAGQVLALVFERVKQEICEGISTSALDKIAEEMIRRNGGTPSFKGYRGFPKSACISVNDVVIHGIPGSYKLKDGDIVSVDIGVYLDGYHADAAKTFPVGDITDQARELIRATRQAFYDGISHAVEGRRLQDICAAIDASARSNGFSAVRDWVGHGVGKNLHEEPEVPNFGTPGRGPRLYRGMTLAVEPMVNAGGYKVVTDKDGWTIRTADGSLSAHYEHSVAITRGEPLILTAAE